MEQILLFVDDEPAILMAIKRIFRKLPYKILTANSALEAIDIIDNTPVSVLISDYTMPGKSGAELLSEAKLIRPEMVRIILSGNSDQNSAIEAMNKGEASRFLSKPWNDTSLVDEVEAALATWQSQVYVDFDKRLLNQRAFLQIAESQLLSSPHEEVSIVIMAIRDFSNIEPSLSVQGVAELLINIAPKLDASLDGVSLALLDDQYFCAIVKPIADAAKVQLRISNLVDKFSKQYVFENQQYPVSFDVGYVVNTPAEGDASALIGHAMMALNLSRKVQSDEPIAYQPSMNASCSRHRSIEQNLNNALDRGEFELHYQPKIDVSDNTLHGAEALIRWNSPSLGAVSPFDFIPLAEHNGSINDIGEWVLNEAISQWKVWFDSTNSSARISVNVSPRQLKDGRFINRLENALSTHNIEPSMLELEITESLLVDDVNRTVELLQSIKNLGLKLSIDDFGTGYSSLSYLSRLPVDIIKIDRSFIFPMLDSPVKLSLVNNLIILGHDLGMEIVAEGVEEQQQLEALQEFGCDVIQGYYFSPPVAADAFLEKTKTFIPEAIQPQQFNVAS